MTKPRSFGISVTVGSAAVSVHPVIPYHPAAIEFYKSKGVWTAEAEKANAAVPQ